MSRINRVPFGLQEFLGNTSQGNNPSELLEQVRPGFNMWPLWGVDKIEYQEFSVSTGSLGAGATLTVPLGKVWMPLHFSGRTGMALAGVQQLALRITDPASGVSAILQQSALMTAVQANQSLSVHHSFPQPLLLASGVTVDCVWAVNVGGAARTIKCEGQYYELSV